MSQRGQLRKFRPCARPTSTDQAEFGPDQTLSPYAWFAQQRSLRQIHFVEKFRKAGIAYEVLQKWIGLVQFD
jgi:hypothetical protein